MSGVQYWIKPEFISTIATVMSRPPKDLPAHNYAKPVPNFPHLPKPVSDALSKLRDRDNEDTSSNQHKTFLIEHNQAYYRGPWLAGLPHGKGVCLYADGSYFEGHFDQGQAHDESGLLILASGATYQGSIKKSVIEGRGRMQQSIGPDSSYVYDGQWREGKPNGWGTEQFGEGSEYKGYFVDGLKSCYNQSKTIEQKRKDLANNGSNLSQYGVYLSDKEKYRGEFLNGRMHGFGEYVKQVKENVQIRYTGLFHNGEKYGEGSLHTSTGVLTGKFEKDVVNGKGKFEWKDDGKVYEGNFRNSKPHGEGRIILPNGNVLEGTWEDGHSVELKAVKTGRN